MFDCLAMSYKDSIWLCHNDRWLALTQKYIFGADTYLGIGVMSAFVFQSNSIAWAHTSTFVDSAALGKDSDYTAMNAIMHWHLGVKTHPVAKL